jgi:hypothetical protein
MAEYLDNCLQLGMIVDALNYVIDETFQITDPTKLMYNEWYSKPDFILSRFDKSFIETDFLIPVMYDIIQSRKGQTPLEELEKRYLVNSNK